MVQDGRWAKRWDYCQECGTTELPHRAHGLCTKCYMSHYSSWYEANKRRPRPLIVCKDCGKEKPHHAKGLCKYCYLCKQDYGPGSDYGRQWFSEHPSYHKKWREAHPGYCAEKGRKRRENGYYRKWCAENRDKVREYGRRRRALKNGATIEPVDEAAIYEQAGYMCIYCGATEDLALDHIVPLAGGGPHSEENLVVACRSCNSSKGAKPLEDWLQTRPRALAWVT